VSSGVSATNLAAAKYSVTVTDANNCTANASPKVNEPQVLVLNTQSIDITCYGFNDGKVIPSVTGGTPNYLTEIEISGIWSTAFTNLGAGIYNIRTTDSKGCSTTSIASVIEPLPITPPNLGYDTTKCKSETINLNPGTYASYLWQDGSTGSTYAAKAFGTYTVTVADGNGCEATDEIIITEKDCDISIAMPTAFSPNGDGKNDIYLPVFINNPIAYELRIYNRWGEKVFESNDINMGWNGYYKGAEAPMEMYTWSITYTNQNGDTKSDIGNVALIR
jgi:gliding motility-associated-like protein